MRLSTLCAAAALAIGSVGLANATPVNLIQNGDFSQVTFGSTTPSGTEAVIINRTNTTPPAQQNPLWVTVDDWQVSNNKDAQTIWYKSANGAVNGPGGPLLGNAGPLVFVAPPPSGSGSFVGLNGDTGGNGNPNIQAGIRQQLTGLTVGSNYIVTFDWAAAQQTGVTGPTTDYLQVSLGGQSHNTGVLDIDTHGFSGWQTVSFGFTATSETDWLSFLAFGTPAGAPPMALLTNVSLSVPEPSEIGLFGLGLLALGGMAMYARRRETRRLSRESNA